jgi:hypothetical protein
MFLVALDDFALCGSSDVTASNALDFLSNCVLTKSRDACFEVGTGMDRVQLPFATQ